MRTFVFHGKETETFHTLGRSIIATCRVWRDGYLNETRQEIEKQNVEFQVVQQCPSCRLIDIPYFRLRWDGTLSGRACRDCNFEWHTVG